MIEFSKYVEFYLPKNKTACVKNILIVNSKCFRLTLVFLDQ